MLDETLHDCPRCDSPVPREHYARTRVRARDLCSSRTDEFLWCEFCGYGIEVSRYPDGEVFAVDFQERTEPVNFGKFLQRLELARVA